MNAKNGKTDGNKERETQFGASFKSFQNMFEKMSKCCEAQDRFTDCCGMMDESMKERMREMMIKCCGPRPGDKESHSEQQKV